ncbi:unnamed protein product [Phaedon cochleariae]|uniref:Uncharacterized protein n=1 Tax=Phaedon cochleariae TaxID=80249 RepID=A0A9N9SK97_PHACE|nr:unnamed protein product [Phaedon cochleariae]
MSPASAGNLEVERYIGACLISQNYGKHQRQDQYWAGKPYISLRQDADTLARLAVHAQGAPLVLTKTYNHRKNKVHRHHQVPVPEKKPNADAVSVTSDESANSETCLPRIIKPRKRRKKDRKLPALNRCPSQEEGFSTDSASPEIDHPYVSLNQFTTFHRDPYNLLECPPKLGDISETPNLHHSFEDVEEPEDPKDLNGNQSSCQCRLCDPSGQIWDVDRECYSPFLTPPMFRFFDERSIGCLERGLSSVSLDEKTTRSSRSSSSSCSDLEVSTEIVTSLNGHRDLEIRFFSSGGGSEGRNRCGGGFVAEE